MSRVTDLAFMAAREETREIPSMSFRASFRPESVDEERRTVEMTWTTGARVLRQPWFGEPFYEELSTDPKHVRMTRLQSGNAPFLDSHSTWGRVGEVVLGVIESARLEGKAGVCKVRFPSAEVDPEADKVFRKIIERILPNVSVGYRIYRMEKVEDGLETIPVLRAVDWEPVEVSCVPMGADPGAVVRSDRPHGTNPCIFVSRTQESTDMEPSPTTPAPAPTEPPPATATVPEEKRAADAARKAEKDRIEGIQRAVRAAGLDPKEARDLEDKLVKSDVALDAARAQVLDVLAAKHEATRTDQHVRAERVEVVEMESEKWRRGAGAALLVRSGYAELLSAAAKKRPDDQAFRGLDLDPGEFRGRTLLDLARESLENAGVKTRGMGKMDLVAKAFTYRGGGMSSTSDFPVLLENVLHKVLQAAYAMASDSWRRWCAVGSVSDFRAHNRYRLGSFGALDSVNEGGEFKYKAIPDGEKASITATTKGNLIALTRQAIINDDLGQFTSLAQRLGRAAGLSIETDAYSALTATSGLGPTQSDTNPLFHSSRVNVGTGATISVASIEADRVLMAQQKDPAGKEYLDLRPAVLVLPIGLGGTARVINQSQYDVDPVTTNATNKFQMPNKVVGLFRDIVDTPRLTGTRRYMFADPSIAPVFEVAFLDGNQSPYMETQEGWNIDGTSWKVRIDYGVGAVDYRGAVTNAGTP